VADHVIGAKPDIAPDSDVWIRQNRSKTDGDIVTTGCKSPTVELVAHLLTETEGYQADQLADVHVLGEPNQYYTQEHGQHYGEARDRA
jgi:hypothetical protein